MNEARRLCDLAQFCRSIAGGQHDPDVLDVLHDLEQDFIQTAGVFERRPRHDIFAWDSSDVAAGWRARVLVIVWLNLTAGRA